MSATLVAGQNNQIKKNVLSDSDKESAVNSISKLLYDNYIFPEVSVKMENYVKSKLSENNYDTITDPQEFAQILTTDLQSVSNDKHIRVQFNPDQIKHIKENNTNNDEEITQEYIDQLKSANYFFKKVEILSGNIGYIDFRQFGPGEQIKDKVASVMGFVENCDALIFDMRYNGGGDPTGIQVISSYLFGDEPVHLNDLYFRPNDTTQEFWTLKDIKGKRMPDVPVFVLTSSFTFSGAEEFSYNLQNLKRAAIVGETTGGGAHPGGMNIVDDNFLMFVPMGRAINPITKTNWEGTGVSPDINISSTQALVKAHILALEKINMKSNDVKLKEISDWLIESLSATLENVYLSQEILNEYCGDYGDRKISFENGKLYYQRNGRQKFELTAMTEDTFMFSDIEYFRIQFLKDDSGKIIELKGLYSDGHSDSSKRKY
ncbi:MAG TPA: S41 family peptidase [Ignavibacteria bacterium]|nr:S41 family peptidase [Ignavibacteria bacterium]HMR40350.1 S41 family peptidase [Ignavibacteria bacterium]